MRRRRKSEPKRKKSQSFRNGALKEEIEALREEVKRLNDLYLRTLADAEILRGESMRRDCERKYGAQFLLRSSSMSLTFSEKRSI